MIILIFYQRILLNGNWLINLILSINYKYNWSFSFCHSSFTNNKFLFSFDKFFFLKQQNHPRFILKFDLSGIMSQTSNVVKNKVFFNVLSKSNSKMSHSIIKSAYKNLINTICECILNCMIGNIIINNETKIILKRHKEVLRKISVKKRCR